jgi:hypothetical protein
MSIRTSSRSTFTSRKVHSSRSMAPCRSHHGNHTRKELGHCSDPLRNESHNMQLDRNRGPKVDKPLQVRQRDVPLWITVTSGRLLWHRNQSHTCAPCNMKKEKNPEVYIHLFRCYTHTPAHILHGLEECQQDKGNEPQRGRQWCELQCSNPFKSALSTEWAKLPCGTESKTSIRHCMIYSSNRAPQAN